MSRLVSDEALGESTNSVKEARLCETCPLDEYTYSHALGSTRFVVARTI